MKKVWAWLHTLHAGDWVALLAFIGGAAFVIALVVANLWSTVVSSLQPEMINSTGIDYDLIAQRSMSAAAWWMVAVTSFSVLVGGASLYLIARTLEEARRSANAAEYSVRTAREIGMAQVRAYVTVERVELQVLPRGQQSSLRVHLKNTGQSPCVETRIEQRTTIRAHFPSADVAKYEHLHRSFPGLASGQPTHGLVFFPSDFLGFDALLRGESRMFVDVRISAFWEDVFEIPQKQDFRFAKLVSPNDLGQPIELTLAQTA